MTRAESYKGNLVEAGVGVPFEKISWTCRFKPCSQPVLTSHLKLVNLGGLPQLKGFQWDLSNPGNTTHCSCHCVMLLVFLLEKCHLPVTLSMIITSSPGKQSE